MAYIDVLLERIADPALRESLTEEIASTRSNRKFGLVFERHLPESVETPGVRPRPGDRVAVKLGDKKRILRVVATKGEQASIVEVLADGTTGDPENVAIADLVVVREFNDPIYAGMKQLGVIDRGGGKPTNTVIRGENYHALEALLYTHQEKIDVIYIDPPYNTGSDSWIYNDRYVDGNDGYRHSKWLAFMERRLLLAKRLLKDTGVIIIAIDDNEQARLKLLCDDVFGEANFIANVVWQGGASSLAKHTSGGLDYMLVYAKDRRLQGAFDEVKPHASEMVAVVGAVRDSGGTIADAQKQLRLFISANSGDLQPGLLGYSQVDDQWRIFSTTDLGNAGYRPNLRFTITDPVSGKSFEPPHNGWKVSPEVMDDLIANGRLTFTGALPRRKNLLTDNLSSLPAPSFNQDRGRATRHLAKIIGSKDFPFPKDVDVLARWINIVSANNPNAVVLDFFAGTGTTAEAVMRLNAQDGGRRQSIIVTNNELASTTAKKLAKAGFKPGDPEWEAEGVFEKVTWPRVETVVTGVRRDGSAYSDGLAENVRFLELTYEDEKLVALGRRFKAVAPLLWLKAGGSGAVIDELDPSGFAAPTDARYAVLFDTDHLRDLAAAIQNRDDLSTVFIVSASDAAFQATVRAMSNHGFGLQTIHLYWNYLRSFRINTQGA